MQSLSLLVPRAFKKWKGFHDIQSLLLYSDNHVLVMYKPPTLLMQGDKKNPSTNNLLDYIKSFIQSSESKPGDAYVGLVHRLDRPVSGVTVFAKTSKAASRLSESFRERTVDKNYVCVVNGKLAIRQGTLHHSIADPLSNRLTLIVPSSVAPRTGKKVLEAKLSYEVLHEFEKTQGSGIFQTLVKVKLETGRKHQIRAQMAHIGHPIVGDVKYGAPQRFQLRDIALHSYQLSFVHPTTKANMTFSASVPSAWASRFGEEVVGIVDGLTSQN